LTWYLVKHRIHLHCMVLI